MLEAIKVPSGGVDACGNTHKVRLLEDKGHALVRDGKSVEGMQHLMQAASQCYGCANWHCSSRALS